jgi:hypothetical protein
MSVDVTLELTLSPREPDALRTLVDAVSDPADLRYGRHLDRAELGARVALAPEDRAELVGWFSEWGLTPVDVPALDGGGVREDHRWYATSPRRMASW